MKNDYSSENKWKKATDNILIFNLYILIIGAIFFVASVLLSLNGIPELFNFFQKLWFPVFIPALSLFFTAILIEATLSNIKNRKID
tara:strand:+ start:85 stop:342 length:258 start_codon:yes stop_codon:yes gene_type:complete